MNIVWSVRGVMTEVVYNGFGTPGEKCFDVGVEFLFVVIFLLGMRRGSFSCQHVSFDIQPFRLVISNMDHQSSCWGMKKREVKKG